MNECLMALCLTLFSDFGTGYGAEVSNDLLYLRAQQIGNVVPITQGVKLSKYGVSAYIGFGSLYQDNESLGLNFAETELRYTWDNGLYARAAKIGTINHLAIGISRTF